MCQGKQGTGLGEDQGLKRGQGKEGTGSPDTNMRGALTIEDLEFTPPMGEMENKMLLRI